MRVAACLVLLLLFSSPAAAESLPPMLTGSALGTNGNGRIEATLAGAVWNNVTQGTLLGDTFRLAVVRGELEVDTTEWDLYAAGAGVTPARNSRHRQTLDAAMVTDFQITARGRILILGGDNATQAAAKPDALELSASTVGKMAFDSMGNQKRTDLLLDCSRALTLHAHGGAVTVSGAFRVAVWGANFTMQQGGTETVISTGETHGAPAGSPGTVPAPHATREAFMVVHAGTATIPLGKGFQTHFDAPSVVLDSGSAILHDPSGMLPIEGSQAPVTSRELVLEAPFALHLDHQVGRVGVAFTETPPGVVLDGRSIRPAAGHDGGWMAAALVGLVAIPLAGRALSQRRLRRQLRDLDGLLRAQSTAALGLARRIRRHRPRQMDAVVAETVCLLQARQYQAAGAVLDEPVWPPGLQPMRSYLLAHVLAGQGRHADATLLLQAALVGAPEMRREASANPLLAPLLAPSSRRGGRHAVSGAP